MNAASSGVVACALVALGCASPAAKPAPPKTPETAKEREVPADIVERSRLPLAYQFAGTALAQEQLLDELDSAAAVCIGESHDNPHHHYAQLHVLRALLARHSGKPFAVGFEMFQTPFQSALDAYADDGDAQALFEKSEFEKRWGGPFVYYAPLLEAASDESAMLLALNAPRELSKAVAKRGVSDLSPERAMTLPELNLADAAHRAFFEEAMGMSFDAANHDSAHSAHGSMSLENLYAAQVVWDETMAQTAAAWLAGNPTGQLVIIAGSGHCQRSAVPSRIERRVARRAVAARAVMRSQLKDEKPSAAKFDLLLIIDDTSG